jgi:hypothetical protein
VILGNPPYVRQERFGDDKPALGKLYKVFNTIADLYTYFIEQGHIQIRPNGRFGMITANKFMRANYGAALRKFLTTKVKLETLIDFGELRVFDDATPDPMITVSANEASSTSLKYVQVKHLKFSSLHEVVASSAVLLQENAWQGSNWSLANASQQTILDKIQENMTRLGIYSQGKIRRGILTGYNEAFIIDQATRERLIAADSKSAEIIKPFLVGDDVRRYHANFKDQYLIWSYVGVPIDKYPAIYEHLQQYQEKLEKRWDKGKYWWELRHCDYYADFEKPKIIYPDISMSSRFVLDRNAYYTVNTTYFIPIDDAFLLALLNSELIWLYLKRKCTALGDVDERGRLRLFSTFVESLPIRRINFVTSTQGCATYFDEAKSLYQRYLNDNNNDPILNFVRHHLSQEPEASDVVHDLLAYLAEEMLHLNEKKQGIQKTFLHYLTDALHAREKSGRAGLGDLTGKSRLLNYSGDYRKEEPSLTSDALWEIIVKNRSRIGAKPSPTLKANILAKYEPNQKQIDDLQECLKRTDDLIDQIVYRLYGLTEDEITVVEEKS